VRSEIEVGNRTNPLSPNSHNELKSTRRAAAVLKSIVMIVFAIFYGWRGTGYEAAICSRLIGWISWKNAFGNLDKISSRDFIGVWTERINNLANRYSVADIATPVSRLADNRARHVGLSLHKRLRASGTPARRVRIAFAGLHRQ
jgi:hypothetical protein